MGAKISKAAYVERSLFAIHGASILDTVNLR